MPDKQQPWFVDFQDVWLAYNEELLRQNHFAVEAIDLKVRQGEFIAIVGPSGCGKSTFMKLTTGLKMPSKGRILIDGQPVTGPLKISGMAFQASSLLPWRTTVDNVLLPLEIVEPYRSNFKARRKEYEERARKLRESVFLADTVYVMSKSPGRFVVKKEIDLPRPRDLEVTYTKEFTDIVHELRSHIGAMRKPAAATGATA